MQHFFILFAKLLFCSYSIEISSLPESGTPPFRSIYSAAAFDKNSGKIILYGGATENFGNLIDSLSVFDVSSNSWSLIESQSLISPPGLYSAYSFISPNGKFYLIFGNSENGLSSDIYSFDFDHLTWSFENPSGDLLKSSVYGASCTFEHDSKNWLAIYGGVTVHGESGDLYLIDQETLKVSKMPNTGYSPGKRIKNSLSYYNGFLYLFGDANSDQLNENVFYKYSLVNKKWGKIEVPKTIKGRKLHYSAVYSDILFILYGFSHEDDCYNYLAYKLKANEWEIIEDENFSFAGSNILIDSKLYIILGSSDTELLNNVVTYELSSWPLIREMLVESLSLPYNRKNHVSFALGKQLYIFGGVSKNNLYLNDLWSYDIDSNSWNEVKAEGSIPSGRELMGATVMEGIGFLIAGGKSSTQIYSDLHLFNYKSEKWIDLFKNSFEENPHYGSCLGIINLTVIVFGGRNNDKLFTHLRIYDLYEKEETEIDFGFEDEIVDYNCQFLYYSDYVELFVIGGRNTVGLPNNKIYKIKISGFLDENYTVTLENEWTHRQLPSESSLVFSDGYAYLLGGTFHGDIVNLNITSFSLENPKNFKTEVVAEDFGFFSHSAALIGREIYVFGGCKSVSKIKLSNQGTNRLYRISSIYNKHNLITCSYGVDDIQCIPCSKGHYFENGVCKGCPEGKHSSSIGAKSIDECIPCPYGTFNDISGSSICKSCPFGTFCPIGSKQFKEFSDISDSYSIQPKTYKGPAELIQNIFYLCFIIGSTILLIVIIFLIYTHRFRSFLIAIDFFVDKHNKDLGVPIIHKKTLVGGVFSCFFLLFIAVTIATSMMTFVIDNIVEARSLVPKLNEETDVTADILDIKLKLYEYGGVCSVDNECYEYNNYTESGFDFKEREVYCYQVQEDCIMEIHYKFFSLGTDGKIYFHLKDMTAYASSISLELLVSSSVPGEYSKIHIPVSTTNNFIFKGLEATKISVEFIQSMFESQSSKWANIETGYHLNDLKSHTLGSTTDIHHFNNQFYLLVEVDLKLSSLGFTTKRNIKSTWMIFFAALIGSIFGVMQSFGGLMAFTEKYIEKIQANKCEQNTIESIKKARKTLLDSFEKKPKPKKRIRKFESCSIKPVFELKII